MTSYTAKVFDHYDKHVHTTPPFVSPPGQSIEQNARAALDRNPPVGSSDLRGGTVQIPWLYAIVKDAEGNDATRFFRYNTDYPGTSGRVVVAGESRKLNAVMTIDNDGPVYHVKAAPLMELLESDLPAPSPKTHSCIICRDPTFIEALKLSLDITLVLDPFDPEIGAKCEGMDIFAVAKSDVPPAARAAGRKLYVKTYPHADVVVGKAVELWGYLLPSMNSMGLADSIDIGVIQNLFLTANGGKQ